MKFKDHWGTHLPFLMKLFSMTDGPILELGIGVFSTVYLHWACYTTKRELVSYENEKSYFDMFYTFHSDYHKIYLVSDYAEADIERPWDIAFLDNTPRERRHIDAIRLKDYAKFVLLHDSDGRYDKYFQFSKVYPEYKYYKTWAYMRPHATVVSNFVDVTGLEP